VKKLKKGIAPFVISSASFNNPNPCITVFETGLLWFFSETVQRALLKTLTRPLLIQDKNKIDDYYTFSPFVTFTVLLHNVNKAILIFIFVGRQQITYR
jgi:hypothetical protein